MYKEQRERLEQELKFLRESLEADVISKDEYEKGKERIERKLREIEEKTEEGAEEIKEEPTIEIKEIRRERPKRIKKPKEEAKEEKSVIEEKEEAEEAGKKEKQEVDIVDEEGHKQKLEVYEETEGEIEKEEAEKKPIEEEPTEEKEKAEAEEEKKEEVKEEEKEEPEERIKISKKWLYGGAIVVIALILIFSVRSCFKTTEKEQIPKELTPLCSSDSDCKQEGKIGACLNPATKEAECEFREDVRVELIIINDQACELCSTDRMKNVIKEIFPNLEIKNLDYKTTEAKELIDKFNINALPAYIFGPNISKAINFNDFKSALIKKGDNYLINNRASGANYYFKRGRTNLKLDLFLTADMEEEVNKNLNEFLELFEADINFTKHLLTEKEKIQLSEELGITSYPTFLINNQIKFGGFQSANAIKEKFCKLNKLDKCKAELQKNIK